MFRGKTLLGNWVEGDLLQYLGYGKAYIVQHYKGAGGQEVVPATVGQYTGLTDKNGKKIFEGDIVRTQPFSDKPYSSKAKYKQHIGVVEYRVQHFKNSLYEQDYEGKWIVKISDYGKFACCNWNEFFKCEVIGNIYDNPELLEDKGE